MVARQGTKSMIGSAIVGGVLLGLIEGMGIMMNSFMSQQFRPQDPRMAPQDPAALNTGLEPGQEDEGMFKKLWNPS